MTEQDWFGCSDPDAMLAFLQRSGRPSPRKLRLFACACCRRVSHLLDEHTQRALVALEGFADSGGTPGGVAEAVAAAEAAEAVSAGPSRAAARAVATAWALPEHSRSAAALATGDPAGERAFQAGLLREVVGSPFRETAIEQRWLSWNHGTVPAVARYIYEGRSFYDMTVLADALEDAGCADEYIVGHCRRPSVHVRGCWLVDLVLGKR